MIPNDDKTLYAQILETDDYYECTRIIAWNEDGIPLIVLSRGLAPANRVEGYRGVRFFTEKYVEAHRVAGQQQRLRIPKPKPEEPKPFKSRFAVLAEKHGGATPEVKWEEPDWHPSIRNLPKRP